MSASKPDSGQGIGVVGGRLRSSLDGFRFVCSHPDVHSAWLLAPSYLEQEEDIALYARDIFRQYLKAGAKRQIGLDQGA